MGCKMIIAFSIASVFLASFSANAQILGSPCSTSMLTNFTPCMNFITNSSANATSPTSDCCNVLKTVMSNGTGCMCLIATGAIPFNIPINRSLALSLPRACNMPGVPLQCKASGAQAPAPSPLPSSPGVSPAASPSATGSDVPNGGVSPTLAPEAPTDSGLTPPATTTTGGSASPAGNDGNRQSVTPSAASTSMSFSPLFLVALIGAVAMKNY